MMLRLETFFFANGSWKSPGCLYPVLLVAVMSVCVGKASKKRAFFLTTFRRLRHSDCSQMLVQRDAFSGLRGGQFENLKVDPESHFDT